MEREISMFGWSVEIQSKPGCLIDLLDLFHRESRDSLLNQNLRQSGDVIEIDHATSWHVVTSIQNNFHGNISNGTSDGPNRNCGTCTIRRIAA